jgi:hypothetical protein
MIAPVLSPQFGALDIIGLPNWQGYSRMQPRGEAILPFSFCSLKDDTAPDDAVAERVRQSSRSRFGMSASDIDALIEKRRAIYKKPPRNREQETKEELSAVSQLFAAEGDEEMG